MLANRIHQLSPSATLSLNAIVKALQAQGRQVINLTAGEPDFDPPKALRQAVVRAVGEGYHRYTPVAGLPELRSAIAQRYDQQNRINYTSEEVVISAGAKQVLHNALLALVNPGDEVLIHTPTWSTYVEQIKLAGGLPLAIELRPPFQLKAGDVAAKVSSKTKVLILNYPGNPTGMTVEVEELAKIAALAVEKGFWIISDEIYERILFDGHGHTSIASLGEGVRRRILTVGGLSKSQAVTGWRLGWGAGPKQLIEAMTKLQGQTTSGACSIVQRAAASAFEDLSFAREMTQAFQARRDYLLEGLGQIDGLELVKPQGAFYLFVGIKKLLGQKYATSADWCQDLLEERQLAVVPGEAFLAPGYFRLSFAASQEDLEKAVEGLRKFCG